MGQKASRLLQCVAKAAVASVPYVGGFAAKVWENWQKGSAEAQLREELLEVARATTAEEINRLVAQAVADAGIPVGRRPEVERALQLLPATVRAALRRPSDETGRTLPPDLRLTQPADLARFLPPRPVRFSPGDHPPGVGDWVLTELLGVGGFGEVWKATNPTTRQTAALKFCTDPDAAAALRNEAAILSVLMDAAHRHPGVVALLHTYLTADPPCLEYELVEGGDLAGVIAESRCEPPPPRDAAGVVRALAETVGWMHRGVSPPVVHRDLKPANVLVRLRPDGSREYKVTDFGIGALCPTADRTEADCVATQVRGAYTPHYASPQQVAGLPPDPRDDVFALGVIWYQLLTGDLTRGRPGGTAWQQRLADRGMSARLIRVLASCLEDETADRPADAADLAERLADALRPSPPARPATWSPPGAAVAGSVPGPPSPSAALVRRRAWAAGAGGLLAATLAGGAFLYGDAMRGTAGKVPGWSVGEIILAYAGLGAVAGAAIGASKVGWMTVVGSILGFSVVLGIAKGQSGAVTGAAVGLLLGLIIGAIAAVVEAIGSWAWVRRACGWPPEPERNDGPNGTILDGEGLGCLAIGALALLALGGWCVFAPPGKAPPTQAAPSDDEQAVAAATEKVRQNPSSAAAHLERGRVYARQGKHPLAVRDLNEAIRLDPKLAPAYAARAGCYGSLGDQEQAGRDAGEAVRLDPNSAEAYHVRAVAFRTKGEVEKARRDVDQALRLDPTLAGAYVTRAWLLQNDPDQAVRDCTEALRLDPKFVKAYLIRAGHLMTKGSRDLCMRDLDEALRLAPNSAEAHLLRGEAHELDGQHALAAACYRRAIDLGTLSPEELKDARRLLEAAQNRRP